MGSGTSRGKKVAPARVGDVNVAEAAAAAGASPKRDRGPFKPLEAAARQPDCHSQGTESESDSSREDADADGEPRGRCHPSPEGDEGPRGSRDVNTRSSDAFAHANKASQRSGFQTRGALLAAAPATRQQSAFGSSSPTMPVVPYHGSEEELMDTIERDFS